MFNLYQVLNFTQILHRSFTNLILTYFRYFILVLHKGIIVKLLNFSVILIDLIFKILNLKFIHKIQPSQLFDVLLIVQK